MTTEHNHDTCVQVQLLRDDAERLERQATEGLVGLPRLRRDLRSLATRQREKADSLERNQIDQPES